MKKHSNGLLALISLLVVAVVLGFAIYQNFDKADVLPLTVTPLNDVITTEGEDPYFVYATESMDLVDENLLEPLREKFGIEDPADSFSRCASTVSYTIDSDTSTDGYFYGTVTKYIGCGEESGEYAYRINAETGLAEMQDSEGNYVPVEDWEPDAQAIAE